MRLVVTATGDDGRSHVASIDGITPEAVPGLASPLVALLYRTTQAPPPPRPPSPAPNIDVELPAGQVRWMVVEHAPHDPDGHEHHAATVHTTDAVDLVHVVDGALSLILDDGEHPLRPGDCVVMAGVPHGMRAGPEGCRLLCLAIGTPPPG